MKDSLTGERLHNQTILFLSLPRHDGKYTSTPWQLAVALAETNTVYFVDHPFTVVEMVKDIGNKQIRSRSRGYRQPMVEIDGVRVIRAPFVLPVNFLPPGAGYSAISRVNQMLLGKRIRKQLRADRVKSIVFINSFNFYYPNLERHLGVAVQLNIYHCIDPMVKSFTLKHGRRLQEIAARKADVIICTAPALAEQFKKEGYPEVHVVPNAANYALFHSACDDGTPVHQSVGQLEGKVLGYLGNIERRTDFKLLLELTEILTDWTIVLAGPVQESYVPEAIRNCKRIIFTGPVAHQEAPAVVKRFDVAMIPFVVDDVSAGIYPLKLFEYLACGKPVVCTPFNVEVLNTLADVMYIGQNAAEFAKQVNFAYATDSEDSRTLRAQTAAQNSWGQRAIVFGSIIRRKILNRYQTSQLK